MKSASWSGVALALLIAVPAHGATAQATRQTQPLVFEYTYEYNTEALNENHYIVLDTTGGRVRGWYYGTSDDFDSAREGYLPGFFVAEMKDLVFAGGKISFTLARPDTFFTARVPIAQRSAAQVRGLKIWTQPLPLATRSYAGSVAPGRIVLQVDRRERVFVQRQVVRVPEAQFAERPRHDPVRGARTR